MFPLDDAVYGNVEQPVLFLNSESFHWKGNVQNIKKLIGNGTVNICYVELPYFLKQKPQYFTSSVINPPDVIVWKFIFDMRLASIH